MTMEPQTKTFKEYCIEYKSVKDDIFKELITFESVMEGTSRRDKEGKRIKTKVNRIKYNNDDIQRIYKALSRSYGKTIGVDEVEGYFQQYLISFFHKQISKETIEAIKLRHERQLTKWAYKVIRGRFQKLIEKEYGKLVGTLKDGEEEFRNRERQIFINNPTFDDINDSLFEHEEPSYIDRYIYDEYQSIEDKSEWLKFIESIDVKDILTLRQKEVYDWMVLYHNARNQMNKEDRITYEYIANQMNISLPGLKKHVRRIEQIVESYYRNWKLINKKQIIHLSDKIDEFLKQYYHLKDKTYDVYWLYELLISWLRLYYIKGHEDYEDLKDLHKNKSELLDDTIFALITDNFNDGYNKLLNQIEEELPQECWDVLYNHLEFGSFDDEKISTDKITYITSKCVKIFENYMKNNYRDIHKVLKLLHKKETDRVQAERRSNSNVNQKYEDATKSGKIYTYRLSKEDLMKYQQA